MVRRADGDLLAFQANVTEAVELADIDDVARGGQAQFHQRQQAVAAGEELGFVAVAIEQAERFVETFYRGVFECCRNHLGLLVLVRFSSAFVTEGAASSAPTNDLRLNLLCGLSRCWLCELFARFFRA